jgi:hypothetical protein
MGGFCVSWHGFCPCRAGAGGLVVGRAASPRAAPLPAAGPACPPRGDARVPGPRRPRLGPAPPRSWQRRPRRRIRAPHAPRRTPPRRAGRCDGPCNRPPRRLTSPMARGHRAAARRRCPERGPRPPAAVQAAAAAAARSVPGGPAARRGGGGGGGCNGVHAPAAPAPAPAVGGGAARRGAPAAPLATAPCCGGGRGHRASGPSASAAGARHRGGWAPAFLLARWPSRPGSRACRALRRPETASRRLTLGRSRKEEVSGAGRGAQPGRPGSQRASGEPNPRRKQPKRRARTFPFPRAGTDAAERRLSLQARGLARPPMRALSRPAAPAPRRGRGRAQARRQSGPRDAAAACRSSGRPCPLRTGDASCTLSRWRPRCVVVCHPRWPGPSSDREAAPRRFARRPARFPTHSHQSLSTKHPQTTPRNAPPPHFSPPRPDRDTPTAAAATQRVPEYHSSESHPAGRQTRAR